MQCIALFIEYVFLAVILNAIFSLPYLDLTVAARERKKTKPNITSTQQCYADIQKSVHRSSAMIYFTAFCNNTMGPGHYRECIRIINGRHNIVLYSLVFCSNGNWIRCDNMEMRKVVSHNHEEEE